MYGWMIYTEYFKNSVQFFLFNQVLLYNLHTHIYMSFWNCDINFLFIPKVHSFLSNQLKTTQIHFLMKFFFRWNFMKIYRWYNIKLTKKSTKKNQLKNQSSTWKILGTYKILVWKIAPLNILFDDRNP